MLTITMMIKKLKSIRRKTSFYFVLVLLPMFLNLSTHARAETDLTMLVTSNLQGKFSLNIDNQENTDPLIILGQNIVYERNNGIDLYLDMGNALYPGVLSKYSSGSIMMDFLDYFSCDALLVSSKDLQIGTKNLQFLQKNKNVNLLSTNILQKKKPIFTPWFAIDKMGVQIAFIGISSPNKIRFDMAEKDLYGYGLADLEETLEPILKKVRTSGIKHIILLTGMNLRSTVSILDAFPEIDLAMSGGDYTGRVFEGQACRLDLIDGRSIVTADDSADYYLLKLVIDDDTIKVKSLEHKNAAPIPTVNYRYQEFINRLTLWKEKFIEEENRLVENLKNTQSEVNDHRFAQLLRDRFDTELGIIEQDTINPVQINQNINQSDLLNMVNRDYHIFIFSLTGDELTTIHSKGEGLKITGLAGDEELSIQGYPLEKERPYRVAASQPAMQKLRHILDKKINYRNTWMTVTDLLMDDLKTKRIVFRKNYEYLDRRFRITIDTYLSNFFDNSTVDRGEKIDTPPGQPAKNYAKWGLENKIDITYYNKYHRFTFTPYMLYTRQDDSYLNNILRGVFLYDYNLSDTIKPYNKFQVDTVVEEERIVIEKDNEEDNKKDNQEDNFKTVRPLLLRETFGISTEYKYISGKLGIGFEKQVQDPSEAALYGIELILGAEIPFWSYFTYTFDIDSFNGIRNDDGVRRQIRSEINNAISIKINSHFSLSFRHKYFYRDDDLTNESYQNSQFITSLNFKNDWKFW